MNYLKIAGSFWCQRCNNRIEMARYYRDISEVQWLCKCNHISKVSLYEERGY